VVGVVSRRAGLGLAEVCVGTALFAVFAVVLFELLSSGATGAARASELQLATTVGARVVDRLLADGYGALAPYAGQQGPIDLSKIGEESEQPPPAPGALVLDGLTYTAQYRLEKVEDGLVQLVVTLTWTRYGITATKKDGKLTLIRFVSDPHAAESAREVFKS
jgi:hypothetical protein